jgi:hypothetical protein
MTRGIIYVVIYYAIFLCVAGVVYLLNDNRPAKGLALHHFIILLSFLGGLFWLMGLVKKFWPHQMTDVRKGIMTAHGFMWIGFLMVIYFLVR